MFFAPRGTFDILPDEVADWQRLESSIRSLFPVYGYREIRTPVIEHTELFEKGAGQTSDLVTKKEMYTLTDRSNRSLTLRPESTAPIVRAYLEHKMYLDTSLVKVYYIVPMFRYERPQHGRYRQHHQFGVEAIGCSHPSIDAEVILLANEFCRGLSLSGLNVQLNSVGCTDCRPPYHAELKSYFKDVLSRLCEDCNFRFEKNPLRIFDCKNPECQASIKDAPKIIDFLCKGCNDHFRSVENLLKEAGVEYEINKYLVRGLDYYTRTTFEVISSGLGAQNTIIGGGRYDGLVEMLGGPSTPAVGFGGGMERLLMAIKSQGPGAGKKNGFDVFVIPLGEEAIARAFVLVREMRRRNVVAEMDRTNRSLKAQMRSADRVNASFAIIIGSDELNKGKALVRNMRTKEQQELRFDELCSVMAEKVRMPKDVNT
jgi:histidyl-tRNA synthetase